jgi:hypothetical protein
MSKADQLLRASSRLKALRANLPDGFEVEDIWVKEFHSCLAVVERATGMVLEEFAVPSSLLKRSVSGGNYVSGEVYYRDGLWCERRILLHRIDAVLLYFEGLRARDDKAIGADH